MRKADRRILENCMDKMIASYGLENIYTFCYCQLCEKITLGLDRKGLLDTHRLYQFTDSLLVSCKASLINGYRSPLLEALENDLVDYRKFIIK
jgi:predicted DNA-binding helix-hairpin-helix protein